MKEKLFSFYLSHKKNFFLAALFLLVVLLLVLFLFFLPEGEKIPANTKTEEIPVFEEKTVTETETVAPAPPVIPSGEENLPEKKVLSHGIDVSKWQGKINWQKVKNFGIDFAMIRLGYASGKELLEDEYARYNLSQAAKSGVLLGVYFYSGAETVQEAEKEADWVIDRIASFPISFPVVLDYELGKGENTLSPTKRSEIALSFLKRVRAEGYGAMLYAPQSEFEDPGLWESKTILDSFPVWIARYSAPSYPLVSYPETDLDYAMWQYTDKGRVDGIEGNVDMNVSYFEGEFAPAKKGDGSVEEVSPPEDFKQTFSPYNQKVTAKISVNLRAIPSINGKALGTLENGEYLLCTGVSDMGWARLEKNGETVYAVASYLLFS